MKTFKLVGRENTVPDVLLKQIGACALCDDEITNFENSFADKEEDKRICLLCVSNLADMYEDIFQKPRSYESK